MKPAPTLAETTASLLHDWGNVDNHDDETFKTLASRTVVVGARIAGSVNPKGSNDDLITQTTGIIDKATDIASGGWNAEKANYICDALQNILVTYFHRC
jgi:hypothetical protein